MAGKNQLKEVLDRLYGDSDHVTRAQHDPISLPLKYKSRADIEIAGFIASALAYGKVSLFLPISGELLDRLGRHPAHTLMESTPKELTRISSGLSYRFQSSSDLAALIKGLARTLKDHGSLEAAFMHGFLPEHENTKAALTTFMGGILKESTGARPSRATHGLKHLLSSPHAGGAAKRACLYLRWMVRDTDIDFGLWRGVPKSKLIIPLDTHIARVSRCLGLTVRRTNNWKTAVEITRALSAFDPADPLKYDFALCHRGISGVCASNLCKDCSLADLNK